MSTLSEQHMDFISGETLLEQCRAHGMRICEVMQARETQLFHQTEAAVREQMRQNLAIMREGALRGIETIPLSVGGLVGGEAKKLYESADTALCGALSATAAAMAMAVVEVNASMGRIVAAPTAGASGVLPGVLLAVQKARGYDDEALIDALFTASAVGMIIQRNASVSGAQGGCQAEVGTASAMAAAALTELLGGSPEAALHAAATALQNLMGLVCDPVAGLVEVPCVKRNAIGANNALLCADMALCGIRSFIPFDETVDAMYRVGCSLPPSLRESAQGGIAATPTAKAAEARLFAPEEIDIPEDLGR